MVAIVSGNSLGLELTSRNTLGGLGLFGLAAQGNAGELVYVNAATGNLVLQRRDEFLAGRGEDIDSVRTYNSLGLLNDDNGDNWAIGIYRQQLVLIGTVNTAGSSVVRTARDGSQATYIWNAERALYVTTDGTGAHDTITYNATAALYERKDASTGCVEKFAASTGRLISIADADGSGVDYTYNDAGLLTKAVSASGDTTWYDYQGTQLNAIRTQYNDGANWVTRTAVRYGYDASGRLSSVTVDLTPEDGAITDGRIYTTNYTYDGESRRVQTISQSDGTALTFAYVEVGGAYRVATITDAVGSVTSFAYDTTNRRTTVTDPLNKAWMYEYDAAGQLLSVTAPATATMAASLQSFGYDGNGNVTSVTNGDGEAVTMAYDGNGNQLRQTDHLGNAVARTYSAANQLLTETVITAAGSATTRCVYAANKPNQLRFVVSAEGRVTQYGYDSLGQRTREVIYPEARYATTALPADSALTEASLTTWVNGITDLSGTARKDYGYDARGLLSYVREYLSTNTDGSGNTAYQTDYTYDAAGRLLQQRLPASTAASGDEAGQPTTTYTYDGLGRVLTVQDARGAVTSTVYSDSTQRATVTVEGGASAASVYDKAGRLISLTRSGSGTTAYAYDAAGRLLMSTDANGVRTFSLYDDAGRRIATVDGDGTLTEFSYDGASRLTRQIVYSTAVSPSLLVNAATGIPRNPALATIRPVVNSLDLQSWNVWDDAGRLAYSIADDGAVVEHEYDSAGRAVRTTAYAARITPTTSPSVSWVRDQLQSSAVTSAAAQHRTTRSFYDADGLRIAELDGEGYLTRHTYDNAGHRVQTRRCATAVVPGLRAAGELSAITPAANPLDQIETFFYDARGKFAGQVDAEGYITRNWYSTRGQLLDQTRYAAKLTSTPTWTDDLDTLIKTVRPGGANALEADDRKSYWRYALDGNVVRCTNFEGTVTTYGYDARGQLIRSTTGDGLADQRQLQVRYDSSGRKTAELSAVGSSLITTGMTQAQIDAVWASQGIAYAYSTAGQLVSKTDANGNKTLCYYDDDGRLVATVNARGEVEQTRYNMLGQRTEVIRYGTRVSTASLAGGRFSSSPLETTLASITDAGKDSKTSYAYDGAGRLLSVTNAVGARTTNTYNAHGELIEQWVAWRSGADINTDRRQDLYVYDRRGLLVQSNRDATGVDAQTASRYDAFGRVIESTDANGSKRTLAYDRLGRQVQTTDALSRSRKTSYDAFSQVLSIENELGKVTSYAYDKTNRAATMKAGVFV